MAGKKLYRSLGNILILACLVIQVSLAMPFLSQIWALNAVSRDVEPILIAPLSECEYIIADKSKEFKFLDKELHRVYPFTKLYSSTPISTSAHYYNQRLLPDNRKKIKYMLMSYFHGSRYKDANPPF